MEPDDWLGRAVLNLKVGRSLSSVSHKYTMDSMMERKTFTLTLRKLFENGSSRRPLKLLANSEGYYNNGP